MNRLMCAWKKKSMGPHTNSLSLLTLLSLFPSLSPARENGKTRKRALFSLPIFSLCVISRVCTNKRSLKVAIKKNFFFDLWCCFFPPRTSRPPLLSLSLPPSLFLSSYSCGTLHALTFQMSSAYSLIVLSLENIPEPATLMIDILVHLSSSRYAASTLSWASM